MPVTQLTRRCWVPSWAGDDRSEARRSLGPHYSEPGSLPSSDDRPGFAWFHTGGGCGGVLMFDMSGGFCLTCGAEGVDEPDYAVRKVVPYQLAEGCWAGTCSRCGDGLVDEEEGTIHQPSADDVRQQAKGEHWDVASDGEITCTSWDIRDGQPVYVPCEGDGS